MFLKVKINKLVFYNHKVGWVKNIPKVNKAEGKNISFNYKSEPKS